MAFIDFEHRMGEPEKSRAIMYRYMDAYPRLKTYLLGAKFEIKSKNFLAARSIFERSLQELGQ